MTITNTGHYHQGLASIYHVKLRKIYNKYKRVKRGKLADILVVYPCQHSESKIEKYKLNNKYIVKYDDLYDFLVNKYPEYFL